MKHNFIGRQRITIKIWSLLCIIIVYFIWISSTIQNDDLNAVDKSTSITCGDLWSCEKTVCIDGECTTTKTNSSDVVDIDAPKSSKVPEDVPAPEDDEGSIDSDNSYSIEDLIEDRLSMIG
jgi:hypothetical protein